MVNGGRDGQAVVTLDGIVATDNGVQGTAPTFTPNQDAIGEMRALLSNYQAEYGVRAGGTIQVAIKNGTQQLHGSAYYYGRNEYFKVVLQFAFVAFNSARRSRDPDNHLADSAGRAPRARRMPISRVGCEMA